MHVARDLAQDPCRRQAVLEHEHKHLSVYRAFFTQNEASFRARLAQAVPVEPLMGSASEDEAHQVLKEAIRSRAQIVTAGLFSELGRRQEEVDSPVEYLRLSTTCGGLIDPNPRLETQDEAAP